MATTRQQRPLNATNPAATTSTPPSTCATRHTSAVVVAAGNARLLLTFIWAAARKARMHQELSWGCAARPQLPSALPDSPRNLRLLVPRGNLDTNLGGPLLCLLVHVATWTEIFPFCPLAARERVTRPFLPLLRLISCVDAILRLTEGRLMPYGTWDMPSCPPAHSRPFDAMKPTTSSPKSPATPPAVTQTAGVTDSVVMRRSAYR